MLPVYYAITVISESKVRKGFIDERMETFHRTLYVYNVENIPNEKTIITFTDHSKQVAKTDDIRLIESAAHAKRQPTFSIHRNQANRTATLLFETIEYDAVFYLMPKGALYFNFLYPNGTYKAVTFERIKKDSWDNEERLVRLIDALKEQLDVFEEDFGDERFKSTMQKELLAKNKLLTEQIEHRLQWQ